jgi:hypothetical protein
MGNENKRKEKRIKIFGIVEALSIVVPFKLELKNEIEKSYEIINFCFITQLKKIFFILN